MCFFVVFVISSFFVPPSPYVFFVTVAFFLLRVGEGKGVIIFCAVWASDYEIKRTLFAPGDPPKKPFLRKKEKVIFLAVFFFSCIRSLYTRFPSIFSFGVGPASAYSSGALKTKSVRHTGDRG